MDLFDLSAQADEAQRQPLAERMRPRRIEDIAGQDHLLAEGKLIPRALKAQRIPSLILWGPPGTGKTTLARLLAEANGSLFLPLSAVMAGVKELREGIAKAKDAWKLHRKRSLLFIDEIHRFNKSQQDALLPHVEDGSVTLVGATTENPSFEVRPALLSRCRVVVLHSLDDTALLSLLKNALHAEKGLQGICQASDDILKNIAKKSEGDGRRALTTLEICAELVGEGGVIEADTVKEAMQHRALLYDAAGEEHYNVISAFIKAMRGSDPDGALYWMTRMLESGEDPIFILRRMVIFASEDVGNADPQALVVATSALQAFQLVGLPEGCLPLTQAVTYLSLCPKSNAVITAYAAARKAVQEHGALPVPMHLRNAPTSLMKRMDYGKGYKYPHDFEGNYTPQSYLPEDLEGSRFYRPSTNGQEAALAERLKTLRQQSD